MSMFRITRDAHDTDMVRFAGCREAIHTRWVLPEHVVGVACHMRSPEATQLIQRDQ
jgi:hypothetical protein